MFFGSKISAFILVFLLTGCDINGSDNLPGVPDLGLFMFVEVNRHETEDSAQVTAAVFKDGQPVDLVGGDVFEARTAVERVLLKDKGRFTGSYATSLPVDNSVQEILINVVHEPVAAREDRWYPVDILNIDPGPGELVGKSAAVSFPPAVIITGPSMATEYVSINDVIDLSWVAIGAGDTMRVLSAISCTDKLANSTYGTVVDIVDDDGLEAISLDKFIYDLDANPGVKFLTGAAQELLQGLLNQLSAGNIDPDFLIKQAEANPINSACEIRLFLQRQREGQFDTTFDSGTVIGSTSAEVTVNYIPNVQTN
ncbi:MAG: hypothetical protein BMS9Abin19_0684 [Gammaproteobacteria bacterium]|nr:MAG: hypothetical protein BMS9Abin19_0684 [Gammaproteobacteria bacterium]